MGLNIRMATKGPKGPKSPKVVPVGPKSILDDEPR